MTDENALLAAIWANPQDDTVRLVYADWLEETGDPARAAWEAAVFLEVDAATGARRR